MHSPGLHTAHMSPHIVDFIFGITFNTLVRSSQRPYIGRYGGAPTAAGWGKGCSQYHRRPGALRVTAPNFRTEVPKFQKSRPKFNKGGSSDESGGEESHQYAFFFSSMIDSVSDLITEREPNMDLVGGKMQLFTFSGSDMNDDEHPSTQTEQHGEAVEY